MIAAAWFGSGFFITVAAAAMFREGGGNVIGAVLTRWHYIALIAPVGLLLLEWRRQRGRIIVLLFIAIVVATMESAVDARLSALRRETFVRTRQFAVLHGVSSLSLLVDIVAAAAVIALDRD